MYCFKLFFVIFAVICSTRSIYRGMPVKSEKRYMVYLLQAEESQYQYKDWTCGGSIVHPWYILTAAACIYNVEHVYVISGTHKYMTLDKARKDTCIDNTKRKIIRHCAPQNYDFGNYAVNGKWFTLDIILGKVDRPYGYMDDNEFLKFGCSYIPAVIEVNYDVGFQQQILDVITLGYGHTYGYGETYYGNKVPQYNSRTLNYLRGTLLSKSTCKKLLPSRYFTAYHAEYSICFKNMGNVNEDGMPMYNTGNDDEDYDNFYGRVDGGALCQNDHGGPLIAWRGGQEIVIGVASYFLVDKTMKCLAPSVFTSTACVNKFLYCKIAQDGARRARLCKDAQNFTEEKDIPWKTTTTQATSLTNVTSDHRSV